MVPAATGVSAVSAPAWRASCGFRYFPGSATNFALQPALQKYTGLPSCSWTCTDVAVTVIPQTGSFSWRVDPAEGDDAALVEQQVAPFLEAAPPASASWI